MDGKRIVFDDLVRCVIDGDATAEEFQDFVEMMRADPTLQRRYCRQMQVHALLMCHRGQEWPEEEEVQKCADSKVRASGQAGTEGRGTAGIWWKVAAAMAVMLGGAAVWRAEDAGRAEKSEVRMEKPRSSVPSPVTMVEWKGASGLELPGELPGRIVLAKGQVKVRLPSGVELTLLGPLELEAEERGMDVSLAKGRLVAWVPPRASGFTVRAPGLTAWDIGTVFSVEADAEGGSLFVFKGSVQALDGAGGGVDICEAGEGVRAMAGRTPFKVAAEGEAGERLFKAVRGYAAVAEPQKALDAARQIGELWMAKYVPEEASRVREAARRQAAMRNAPKKVPFTKTAWVRPSALRQEEDTSNMNKSGAAAVLTAAAVMMGTERAGATSASVFVDTSPCHNRGWMTVCTNEVPLMWDWPASATHAKLEITGMNGSDVTNFTEVTSNCLWRVCASSIPSSEDVHTLALTFYGSGDAVVGALTSQVAVVKGAFGKTAVISAAESTSWPKLKENAVIAYDAGWTAATAGAANSQLVIAKQGGMTQTNALADASGYFGWKVKRGDWGYGTFNLALTFPGTEGEWDGTLVRVPEGFMFSVK